MGNVRIWQGLRRRLRRGFCAAPLILGAPGARWHSRLFIKMPALSSKDLGRRAGFPSCAQSAARAQARTWGATYGRWGLLAAGSGGAGGTGRGEGGWRGEPLGTRMGFAESSLTLKSTPGLCKNTKINDLSLHPRP